MGEFSKGGGFSLKIIGDNLDSLDNFDIVKTGEYFIKLRELKEGEKVSIISDVMFKTMFQNSSRMKYSAKLISYFVDVSYEELLKNLKLTQNDFNKEKYYSKGERGDYVADLNGVNINIEINNNFHDYIFERNLEYVLKLYNKNVKKSKFKSSYKYTQVLQINFNNFYYREHLEDTIKIFTVNDGKVKYTDKIVIIQVYLPLINKKCYDNGIESLNEKERFILALYEMSIDNSKKIGGKIDIMNDYLEESKNVLEEESFGESYDKEISNYQGGFDEGRMAGYEDGKIAGFEDGKIAGYEDGKIAGFEDGKIAGYEDGKIAGFEDGKIAGFEDGKYNQSLDIAKSMKQDNIDIEKIALYTGLDIKEIEKL